MSITLFSNESQQEINFSNASFYALFSMLNLPMAEEYCGSLENFEIDILKTSCQTLLATIETVPEQFTTETTVDKNMFSCGRDSEYWVRRLKQIIELCQTSSKLCWE